MLPRALTLCLRARAVNNPFALVFGLCAQRVGDTLAELRKATESKRFSWATTCAVRMFGARANAAGV